MVDGSSGRCNVMDHVPRVLLDNLDQGVFVLDPRGRCLITNRRLAQWLGRQPVDLVGCPLEALVPALAGQFRAALSHILQGERLETEEPIQFGGELRFWRILYLPVRDGRDQIVGLLGLCRDATDDRNRREQLQQARKLIGLEGIVARVTHDLRNLLTVVRGHLDILGLHQLEEVDQELVPLIAATERAMELSTSLLLSSGQRSAVSGQPNQ
jgi:PAS domain S-box-containing protein